MQKDKIYLFDIPGISSDELERILQSIDEALYIRSKLTSANNLNQNFENSKITIPTFSLSNNLSPILRDITTSQAPYYVISGNWFQVFIKRVHNIILKLFARKQAYFNGLVYKALSEINQMLIDNQKVVENNLKFINLVQEEISMAFINISRENEEIRKELDNLKQAQSSQYVLLEKKDKEVAQTLEIFQKQIDGVNAWLDIVSRKTEMLALGVREAVSHLKTQQNSYPEPYYPDFTKYNLKLAQMNGLVRINLGCGEKPLKDYINIDMRHLPDVDVVADVHRLPYEESTVYEIYNAHLIEHFREHHLRIVLLPYWMSLLKPDGFLRIITPNFEKMISMLNAGQMTYESFKRIVFGAQDYEGDDHFCIFTPDSLTRLLKAVGFRTVEIVVLDRINGGCPEMELIAKL